MVGRPSVSLRLFCSSQSVVRALACWFRALWSECSSLLQRSVRPTFTAALLEFGGSVKFWVLLQLFYSWHTKLRPTFLHDWTRAIDRFLKN